MLPAPIWLPTTRNRAQNASAVANGTVVSAVPGNRIADGAPFVMLCGGDERVASLPVKMRT